MTADRGARSASVGAIALFASLGLAALSLPAALTSLHLAAAEGAMIELVRAARANPPAEAWARQQLAAAAAWTDAADVHMALAELDLAGARRDDYRGEDAERAIVRAVGELDKALALQPLAPKAWLLLAHARYLRDPDDAALPAIIARALQAAPADARYLALRVDLGLRVWDRMGRPGQAALAREVVMLGRKDLNRLVAIARTGNAAAAARAALADAPPLRAAFESAYLNSN